MSTGEPSDPDVRSSTDESLRAERDKTDAELQRRAAAVRDVATSVVSEARDQADALLNEAREREDQRLPADASAEDLGVERAREDAAVEEARAAADAQAREDRERRNVALASLLAFEREHTDLKLETERERADQVLTSREDFMAMVSHDLRSLLGAIALSAELLHAVDKTPEPMAGVQRYAERIQRFAARMNRLVGDLMDVASIEAGKLSLVRVRRGAALLLRDALEAFLPAARARGVELRCEAPEDPGVIEVDHERILQVLTNLVGNALKFTPKGGSIVIRLERRDDDLLFSVIDTGEGIPPAQLEAVFERYVQARDTDRRGLGLGLFIARRIVEGHGGRIWAESTLGQGATLYFTLAPHAAAPPPAQA